MIITHRVNKTNFRAVFNSFFAKVSDAIDSGIGELLLNAKLPSKSDIQRNKYHAMISDIVKQVEIDGRRYSKNVWKARLVEQFARECEFMGEPLTHPGETVLSLDGLRVITVRPSSEDFSAVEAAKFIEFLYQQGADLGVVWSEQAEEYQGNYR